MGSYDPTLKMSSWLSKSEQSNEYATLRRQGYGDRAKGVGNPDLEAMSQALGKASSLIVCYYASTYAGHKSKHEILDRITRVLQAAYFSIVEDMSPNSPLRNLEKVTKKDEQWNALTQSKGFNEGSVFGAHREFVLSRMSGGTTQAREDFSVAIVSCLGSMASQGVNNNMIHLHVYAKISAFLHTYYTEYGAAASPMSPVHISSDVFKRILTTNWTPMFQEISITSEATIPTPAVMFGYEDVTKIFGEPIDPQLMKDAELATYSIKGEILYDPTWWWYTPPCEDKIISKTNPQGVVTGYDNIGPIKFPCLDEAYTIAPITGTSFERKFVESPPVSGTYDEGATKYITDKTIWNYPASADYLGDTYESLKTYTGIDGRWLTDYYSYPSWYHDVSDSSVYEPYAFVHAHEVHGSRWYGGCPELVRTLCHHEDGFCLGSVDNNKEDCVNNGGSWKIGYLWPDYNTTGECDAIGGEWTVPKSCFTLNGCQGEYTATKTECETARCSDTQYTTRETCEDVGTCTDSAFDNNKAGCEAAGYCSDSQHVTKEACEAAHYCWEGQYTTKETCEAAGSTWADAEEYWTTEEFSSDHDWAEAGVWRESCENPLSPGPSPFPGSNDMVGMGIYDDYNAVESMSFRHHHINKDMGTSQTYWQNSNIIKWTGFVLCPLGFTEERLSGSYLQHYTNPIGDLKNLGRRAFHYGPATAGVVAGTCGPPQPFYSRYISHTDRLSYSDFAGGPFVYAQVYIENKTKMQKASINLFPGWMYRWAQDPYGSFYFHRTGGWNLPLIDVEYQTSFCDPETAFWEKCPTVKFEGKKISNNFNEENQRNYPYRFTGCQGASVFPQTYQSYMGSYSQHFSPPDPLPPDPFSMGQEIITPQKFFGMGDNCQDIPVTKEFRDNATFPYQFHTVDYKNITNPEIANNESAILFLSGYTEVTGAEGLWQNTIIGEWGGDYWHTFVSGWMQITGDAAGESVSCMHVHTGHQWNNECKHYLDSQVTYYWIGSGEGDVHEDFPYVGLDCMTNTAGFLADYPHISKCCDVGFTPPFHGPPPGNWDGGPPYDKLCTTTTLDPCANVSNPDDCDPLNPDNPNYQGTTTSADPYGTTTSYDPANEPTTTTPIPPEMEECGENAIPLPCPDGSEATQYGGYNSSSPGACNWEQCSSWWAYCEVYDCDYHYHRDIAWDTGIWPEERGWLELEGKQRTENPPRYWRGPYASTHYTFLYPNASGAHATTYPEEEEDKEISGFLWHVSFNVEVEEWAMKDFVSGGFVDTYGNVSWTKKLTKEGSTLPEFKSVNEDYNWSGLVNVDYVTEEAVLSSFGPDPAADQVITIDVDLASGRNINDFTTETYYSITGCGDQDANPMHDYVTRYTCEDANYIWQPSYIETKPTQVVIDGGNKFARAQYYKYQTEESHYDNDLEDDYYEVKASVTYGGYRRYSKYDFPVKTRYAKPSYRLENLLQDFEEFNTAFSYGNQAYFLCSYDQGGGGTFSQNMDRVDYGPESMSFDPVHWWPMSSSSHVTGTYHENYEKCADAYVMDGQQPAIQSEACKVIEGPLVHPEKIYGDHWVGLRSGCLYGANGYAGNFDSLIDLEGLPATGNDAGYFCDENRELYEIWVCSDEQYLTKEDCDYHDKVWEARMGRCSSPYYTEAGDCTWHGHYWTGSQEYCERDGHEWIHPYSKSPIDDSPGLCCPNDESATINCEGEAGHYGMDDYLRCPMDFSTSPYFDEYPTLREAESRVYLFNIRPTEVDIHIRAPDYVSEDTEGRVYDPTGVGTIGEMSMYDGGGGSLAGMGWAKQVVLCYLTGTDQIARVGMEELPEGVEAVYGNPNNKPIELFKESWIDEKTLSFEGAFPIADGIVFEKPTQPWAYKSHAGGTRWETLLEHGARIAVGGAVGTTVDPTPPTTTTSTTPEFIPGSCAGCLKSVGFEDESLNGYWRLAYDYLNYSQTEWDMVDSENGVSMFGRTDVPGGNTHWLIGNKDDIPNHYDYSKASCWALAVDNATLQWPCPGDGSNHLPNGVSWTCGVHGSAETGQPNASFQGVEISLCAPTPTTPDPTDASLLIPVSGWKETSRIKILITDIKIDGLGRMPVDSYFAMEQSGACQVSGYLQYQHQQEASIYTEGIVMEDVSEDPDLNDLDYPHYASEVIKRDGVTFPTGDAYEAQFGLFNPDFAPVTKDILFAPSRMQVRANELVTMGSGMHNYHDLYRGAPYYYNRYLWPTISDLHHFNGHLLSWESLPTSDSQTYPVSALLCSAAAGQPTANDDTSIFTQRHYVVTQHWMFYDGVVTDPTINREWMRRGEVGHNFFPGGGYVVPKGTTVNDIEQGIVSAEKTILRPPDEAGGSVPIGSST
jgi:hypothetical protein